MNYFSNCSLVLFSFKFIEFLVSKYTHLVSDVAHDTASCNIRFLIRKKLLLWLLDTFILFKVFNHSIHLWSLLLCFVSFSFIFQLKYFWRFRLIFLANKFIFFKLLCGGGILEFTPVFLTFNSLALVSQCRVTLLNHTLLHHVIGNILCIYICVFILIF